MNHPDKMPPAKNITEPITEAEIVKQGYELDAIELRAEHARRQAELDNTPPEVIAELGRLLTSNIRGGSIDAFGIRNAVGFEKRSSETNK